jgi:hypothetical protein
MGKPRDGNEYPIANYLLEILLLEDRCKTNLVFVGI